MNIKHGGVEKLPTILFRLHFVILAIGEVAFVASGSRSNTLRRYHATKRSPSLLKFSL
jgi:hypothetical protein